MSDEIITPIYIERLYREMEAHINNVNNEELKSDLNKIVQKSYKKHYPVITARSPTLKRLMEVKDEVLKLYKSIVNPVKPNNKNVFIEHDKSDATLQPTSNSKKKQKIATTTLSASSADVSPVQQPQQSQQPLTITPATQAQGEALIYAGLDEDDIDKYGIAGDHSEYENWWRKDSSENYNEDILNIVAGEEELFHKYYNNTYTPGQLAKTYNKIAESFIIQRCRGCDGRVIIDYLSFIRNNPQFALPTLLWIDTFHDFKEERLNKGKRNLNDIIDYLCFQIYGYHWGKLVKYDYTDKKGNTKTKFQTVKDCVDIGHTYNFDKMYQNSFFTFEDISPNVNTVNGNQNTEPIGNIPKVIGFHPDVKHTVLSPLVEPTNNFQGGYTQETVAKLLYGVSNVFINTTGGWEADFLYAYLMYNFNFDMTKDGLIQNLRDVFWNEIKADKNESISIPYYAKDVDKGSSNFFKGTNVILPASLFDANRSNSSQKIEEFVNIENTIIPLCNGYYFQYNYEAGKCNLTLSYLSNDNQVYKLCTTGFDNKSSCVNKKERNNYPNTIDTFIEQLSNHKQTQKQPLKDIDTSINEFLGLITSENKYTQNDDTAILKAIRDSVYEVYFQRDCVKIPNGQGMSPIDVVSVVIGLLINTKNNPQYRNGNHPLSPISCKELDFWVALKRIGDFGQIMQCKQIGIPLFTNDNMQLLISMAACSSAVWTGDNSKVLWYDSNKDAILCNGLNPSLTLAVCNKKRVDVIFNSDNKIITDVLLILDNLPTENDYKNIPVPVPITPKPGSDFLNNKIYKILDNIDIIKKNSFTNDNDLNTYFYVKIAEQIWLLNDLLLNINNSVLLQRLKQELDNEFNNELSIKGQNLNPEKQAVLKNNLIITYNVFFEQNIDKLKVMIQSIIEELSINLKEQAKKQLNNNIVENRDYLNTLRKTLESKINSQGNVKRYYHVIEEQLLTGQGKANYISDNQREDKLQTAANIIESKYVDKLADINDIRNGCVIEFEMGREKKEEEDN